jgi:hypothetical protein
LPEGLERQLVEAAPADVMVQVDAVAGWGADWETESAGGLFPDVSELDGEAREALLTWLRQQTS